MEKKPWGFAAAGAIVLKNRGSNIDGGAPAASGGYADIRAGGDRGQGEQSLTARPAVAFLPRASMAQERRAAHEEHRKYRYRPGCIDRRGMALCTGREEPAGKTGREDWPGRLAGKNLSGRLAQTVFSSASMGSSVVMATANRITRRATRQNRHEPWAERRIPWPVAFWTRFGPMVRGFGRERQFWKSGAGHLELPEGLIPA